jgi:hypothetical protein
MVAAARRLREMHFIEPPPSVPKRGGGEESPVMR